MTIKDPFESDSKQLLATLHLQIDRAGTAFTDLLHTACEVFLRVETPRDLPSKEPSENRAVPDILTPAQAAEYLGIKEQTLALWRSTGRYALPFVKVGRNVRYLKADLERFVRLRMK